MTTRTAKAGDGGRSERPGLRLEAPSPAAADPFAADAPGPLKHRRGTARFTAHVGVRLLEPRREQNHSELFRW